MGTAQSETPWYQGDAHRPSEFSVERARLFTMACISLGTMGDEARERESCKSVPSCTPLADFSFVLSCLVGCLRLKTYPACVCPVWVIPGFKKKKTNLD